MHIGLVMVGVHFAKWDYISNKTIVVDLTMYYNAEYKVSATNLLHAAMSIEDVWRAVDAFYGEDMAGVKIGVSNTPVPAGFEEGFWQNRDRWGFQEVGTLGEVFAHEYLCSVAPTALTVRSDTWREVLGIFLGEVGVGWEKMYVIYIYDELRAVVS